MNFRYKAIILISFLLSIINMIALFRRSESESVLLPSILNEQGKVACKSDGLYYVNIHRLISQPDDYSQKAIVVDGFFNYDEIEGVAKIGTQANGINDLSIGEAIELNIKKGNSAVESSDENQKFYKFLNGKHVRIKGVFKCYSCSIQEEHQFIAIGIIQNAEIMSIVGRGILKTRNVNE